MQISETPRPDITAMHLEQLCNVMRTMNPHWHHDRVRGGYDGPGPVAQKGPVIQSTHWALHLK